MQRKYKLRQLKDLYEQFSAVHLANFYSWSVDDISAFDRSLYDQVLESIEPDPCRSGVWTAKSPWEAAIFLMDRQARTSFVSNAPVITPGQAIQIPAFKMIFRGQKARYDNIRPSAWRPRNDLSQAQVDNWSGVFCLLVKLLTEREVNISIQASIYRTAAQHYGIPTEFLDFTIDPNVAIWFANQGVQNAEQDMGQVFFTLLEDEEQMEIFLPPPLVDRLFRQRGIFHFTQNEAINQRLHARCNIIKFPLCPGFKLPAEYPFHKSGQLYSGSTFFADVKAAAYEIVRSNPDDFLDFFDGADDDAIFAEVERLRTTVFAPAIERLAQIYSFDQAWWDAELENWVRHTNNYIDWLCTFNTDQGQPLLLRPNDLNSAIGNLLDRNRDALNVYTAWLLTRPRQEMLGDRRPWIVQLRDELLARYPELESNIRLT